MCNGGSLFKFNNGVFLELWNLNWYKFFFAESYTVPKEIENLFETFN